MPMGTGPDDTGHLPTGPSGGSLLSPAEQQAKINELKAQLAAAQAEADATDTPESPTPTATPAQPTATQFAPGDPNAPQYATPHAAPGAFAPDPAPANQAAPEPEGPFSHWLHLADGRVIKSLGTVTHWFEDEADKLGQPVVAAIANPAYKPGEGDKNARVRAVLAELAALTGIDLSHIAGQL